MVSSRESGRLLDMTASQIQSESLLAARERWVARGVSAPAIVAVSADGAHVEGADGVRYLDFAGGIGCQNLGHNPEAVVEAIHAQVDQYLHQCFMVAAYEPYVDVCRRLGELSPCRGTDQKSILFNSGAEAVENAVKIARAATARPAVVAFDRGFHGRTLMTMTLTSKVKPYKKGFGPFAPEVYRAPAPYPYRGITSDDSIAALEQLFLAHVDPATVAAVILEPVQGEGGFIEMPADFPAKLRELCDRHGILWIDDEVQAGIGRTGPVWAIEHYDAQPDLLVSGKSLGGGLPLAGVTGPASVMDAVDPGGLGGTFGGNPVSCAAANVVLETVATPEFRTASSALGARLRAALEDIASRVDSIGDVRGLGPMLALEIVRDRETKTPAPDVVAGAIAAARKQGLLLLACGLHGNVIRLLPPLTISDEDLSRGLEILEASLV
jgi:4-aminobutyrate aminotransferase/(S)-3-amino-2-methylpropionate transaminase